ncbi:MAG: hypothetical protein HY700_20660 [Gemmatimonadetes bacterium]|nr:hypothetical protein [Gemmatimonadota bacterium]
MKPTLLGLCLIAAIPSLGRSQYAPGHNFSPNVKLVAHVPLDAQDLVADIEIEQELSRPYAYVTRERKQKDGFQIIDLRDPSRARLLYTWFIENAPLHTGYGGGKAGKYFKLNGRYYYAQSFQFGREGVDADLSVIVFDVTGLPDTSKVKEVGRIRVPEAVGGGHNLFAYKHSNGSVLLFITVEAPPNHPYGAHIYDMEKFVAGAPNSGLVGGVPLPEPRGAPRGYHDAYVAYEPVSKQDRFYGGGPETSPLGGNFVYDVTDVKNPKLLASVVAQSSMQSGGHTFVATPDGRYGLTIMTSPAHQPVRLWDLKPALDGTIPVIKQPIGEWTADPKKTGHMIEVRWPYAFIADYQNGLRVLDIRNPTDPVEVGFYDTFNYRMPFEPGGVAMGAYGLDVRNSDGLIVIGDDTGGFFAFKMDGFDGWNGHDWGMPNASSAQDWDNGPDGAPKPAKVS